LFLICGNIEHIAAKHPPGSRIVPKERGTVGALSNIAIVSPLQGNML
jgi:hypothetical protein